MYNHTDRVVIDSQLPEFKGISFTIRKVSHGVRSKIRQQLAPVLAEIREKTEQLNALVEEGGFDGQQPQEPIEHGIVMLADDPDASEPITKALVKADGKQFNADQIRIIERIGDVNNEIEIITGNKIDIVYLQYCFISITGLTITTEGNVAIPNPNYKDVYERGPEELCQEIVAAIKEQAGLSGKVKANLGLPITSGAAGDGQMNDSTAPNANGTDAGDSETVPSSSQNT